MNLFQALLIALLGYLSSIYSPWLSLGGWYTIGRPLVAGFLIGLILGDVQQGIILGAAVQALYIGLVTPGGSMPADVNFAAWIGIPLTMVAGQDANFAVALSVPFSFLGVAAVYSVVSFNPLFVHQQDKFIEEGQLEKAVRIPVVGQISNFVVRFVPTFLCIYLGQDFAIAFAQSIPEWLGGVLFTFGSLLPLIGFAILLNYVAKKTTDLTFYLVGFVLAASLGLGIVPVLVFALLLAYMDFRYGKDDNREVA